VLLYCDDKKLTQTFHRKQIYYYYIEYILLLYCAHLYDEYTYLIRDGCRYHRIMIIVYDRTDINVKKFKTTVQARCT